MIRIRDNQMDCKGLTSVCVFTSASFELPLTLSFGCIAIVSTSDPHPCFLSPV